MPAIFMFSVANAGTGRHSASFRSEPREPKGLILLEALVKLGATTDDFADACLDGLGFECGDGDLPGCRLHKLRCGKYTLADELVNRADADAEPDRGRVGAECLRMRYRRIERSDPEPLAQLAPPAGGPGGPVGRAAPPPDPRPRHLS